MAQLVEVFVVFPWFLAVALRRDDHLHTGLSGAFDDGVCVIPPVGEKCFPLQPFDQRQSLRTISDCTRRDSDSDRKTK